MREPGVWEVLIRVLLSVIPAGLIGLEREFGQKAAGFRTHVLVSLGACLFTLAGLSVPGADPTRVAAQVASGIGFLGAGAILREGFRVRGLTTAASLWVTAAIGVAAGLGAYVAGGIAAGVSLIVLVVLKRAEHEVLPLGHGRDVSLVVDANANLVEVQALVIEVLGTFELTGVQPDVDGRHRMLGRVTRSKSDNLALTADQLRSVDGVHGVELEM